MNPIEKFAEECRSEIAAQGADERLRTLTQEWINCANEKKYSYHFSWLGRPIIQYPQDIMAMQELIWAVKPDLVIETGIAHGGSLILSASILAMLDMSDAIASGVSSFDPRVSKRKVIGVDIDIRSHNRAAIEEHPMASRIEMIQGSSISPDIVAKVRKAAEGYKRVLISLDSNHTHDHVLAELEAYAPLVSIGSYCIVFDSVIEHLPADHFLDRPWSRGNNPMTALRAYIAKNPDFEIDKNIENKLMITVAPEGFLHRLR